MTDYDFSTLNDKEFECLIADILSAKEEVAVERFKSGKDGGVDGRFFSSDGGETIIQCKHWIKSGISKLINHLEKKELSKIQKLSPSRYIIVTSLPLSRKNKEDIYNILAPYIKSETDILGKEDINDILLRNRQIEEKHYKLWFKSTNVLKNVFNKAIRGRSKNLLEDIKNFLPKYVITESHNNALKKLEGLHTVIITGEAGIGKTSLAGQLAYHYVANGFTLYCIENSLNEAEDEFENDEKQIFYFDDFLGSNYLIALENKQDSHIVNFINRVAKNKNKRFILTSRTTILNRGKCLTGRFHDINIDKNEFQLEIDFLTDLDKAKILYNHIFFGDMEEQYIGEIYKDQRYLEIIEHNNYNPRIIQFITDLHRISLIKPEDYWDYIKAKLDNPKDIWADVYRNQIGEISQRAVLLVTYNGKNRIYEDDLKSSLIELSINDSLMNNTNSEIKFRDAMQESVGAILSRFMPSDPIHYTLYNPSVADFILNTFSTNKDCLGDIFLCLNTTQSLNNVETLKTDKIISEDTYIFILTKLANNKLALSHKSSFQYKVKLSNLIFHENIDDYSNRWIDLALNINNYPIINSFISEYCSLLEIALTCIDIPDQESGMQSRIYDYIGRCIDKPSLDHEDYGKICYLAKLIGADENLLEKIKSSVLGYWQEYVNEIINDEQLLDQYYRLEDETYASEKLYDYLSDNFSELDVVDFDDDDIGSVAEYVDIQENIIENAKSMADDENDGYYRTSSGSRASYNNIMDEGAQITDLFYRS